jgi:hypothetical protein
MDEIAITTAYNTLLNASQAAFIAGERVIFLKADIEQTRMAAARDGLITGKNEDERKICAYSLMPDKYHELAVAEKDEREEKHLLGQAQTIVESMRALLRLEELKRQIPGGPIPPLS